MSQERYNTKPTNITGISERNISASQSLNLGRTFLRESVCFLTKYLNATLTMQLQWHFGSNCLIRWTMNVCATVDSLGTSPIAQKAKMYCISWTAARRYYFLLSHVTFITHLPDSTCARSAHCDDRHDANARRQKILGYQLTTPVITVWLCHRGEMKHNQLRSNFLPALQCVVFHFTSHPLREMTPFWHFSSNMWEKVGLVDSSVITAAIAKIPQQGLTHLLNVLHYLLLHALCSSPGWRTPLLSSWCWPDYAKAKTFSFELRKQQQHSTPLVVFLSHVCETVLLLSKVSILLNSSHIFWFKSWKLQFNSIQFSRVRLEFSWIMSQKMWLESKIWLNSLG